MSLSVQEVLYNAEYNISNSRHPLQIEMGRQQLRNYKIAKDLGAKDDDEWSDWEDRVEEEANK